MPDRSDAPVNITLCVSKALVESVRKGAEYDTVARMFKTQVLDKIVNPPPRPKHKRSHPRL